MKTPQMSFKIEKPVFLLSQKRPVIQERVFNKFRAYYPKCINTLKKNDFDVSLEFFLFQGEGEVYFQFFGPRKRPLFKQNSMFAMMLTNTH